MLAVATTRAAGDPGWVTEERFRRLADLVPEQVWISGPAGELKLVNEQVAEYGGGPPPGHVLELIERIHPDDRVRAAEQVAARWAAGEPYEVELRLRRHDGEYRPHLVRGYPERDSAGAIVRWTGMAADRTAARGREEAERASRAKSEFLSRMSHELRTPLNAILGFGQLLELDALTGDQRDSVGHILTAGGHLLELIDEILEISRIEAGALRLALQPVHLAPAVRGVVDLLAPLAAERDVELAVDAGPDPAAVHVLADRQRLDQILLNLIANAIKYNRDGGLVTVRLRTAPDGRARVAVSDTGAGLTAEQLERVFSPFERLGATESGTKGTGLGLAVSRSLAEAMGGELTAASVPGCGCDFSLLLDHAPAPDAGVAAPAALPATRTAVATRGPRRRVLCVEDNASNLRLVERVLEPAGLDVLGAPEGRLGIDLARRHRPDVVLLDLDLPDISGEAVLAALSADPATAAIPVVICSADATAATMERLQARGAAGYLTKPVDMERLLKTVRAHADEGRST